jgi:hypothetical protein
LLQWDLGCSLHGRNRIRPRTMGLHRGPGRITAGTGVSLSMIMFSGCNLSEGGGNCSLLFAGVFTLPVMLVTSLVIDSTVLAREPVAIPAGKSKDLALTNLSIVPLIVSPPRGTWMVRDARSEHRPAQAPMGLSVAGTF